MGFNSGTSMAVFPCRCGHRNKVSNSVKESYRLFILDQLGNCKKCGAQLRKHQFRIKRTKTFEDVEREVEKEQNTRMA
jgi:hypothetical protein